MKSTSGISGQAAVIDLGTNTFHFLAVAAEAGGGWREVSRKQEYVQLAERGIIHIGPAPFARARRCMISFREQMERLDIDEAKVRAVGTAALRQAANASELIEAINRDTGILVEVISGDREASLIARGVSLAVPLPNENALLMDIGGGSVEFIVMKGGEVLWQGSFMVGIALLLDKYRHADPMGPAEITHIESWLDAMLAPLWEALSRYPCKILAGASGAFDVLESVLIEPTSKSSLYGLIRAADFFSFYDHMASSTLAQRLAMPFIPPRRAEMLPGALLLIRFVLQRLGADRIFTSSYALKEGLLAEMLTEA